MSKIEAYFHNRHLQLQLAIEAAEAWPDSKRKRQIISLLEAEKDECALESQRAFDAINQ